MRQSKRKSDMQHKQPKSIKHEQKPYYKLDEPIRGNKDEQNWQLEKRKLRERKRDQLH